ncbi:MAG TPA: hypothetical protein VJB08_06590 [Candidatus Nanoarchaeia archaeon]|nr:hypothetical protein [Candidatus Nanoarchaeia archaeon]
MENLTQGLPRSELWQQAVQGSLFLSELYARPTRDFWEEFRKYKHEWDETGNAGISESILPKRMLELTDFIDTRIEFLFYRDEMAEVEGSCRSIYEFFEGWNDTRGKGFPILDLLPLGIEGKKVLEVGFSGVDYDEHHEYDFRDTFAYEAQQRCAVSTALDKEVPAPYLNAPFCIIEADMHRLLEKETLEDTYDIIFMGNVFNSPQFSSALDLSRPS